MTKQQPTEKSRYKSPSTGEYCTCAQYISEIVCGRMAEKENVGTQPYKFWNTPKWKKVYQYQAVLANRLLKRYREAAIIKALHSPECKNMYSLRYPRLESVIRKYEQVIDQQSSVTTIEIKEKT